MSPVSHYRLQALTAFYTAFVVGIAYPVSYVAFPNILGNFGFSEELAFLPLLFSTLLFLAGLAAAPRLSKWIGAKRFTYAAIGLFILMPLSCAFVPWFYLIMLAVVVSGFVSGCLMSDGINVFAMMAPLSQRTEMLCLLFCCYFIGAGVGVITARWLIDYVNWHWAFLVLAVLGLVLLALKAVLFSHSDVERIGDFS